VRLAVGTPLAEKARLISKYHDLMEEETSPVVIAQIAACSKSNWEGDQFGPLYRSRMRKLPDDPALPLMLWWGLEPHVESVMRDAHDFACSRFVESADANPVIRFSLERLARKIAATNMTQAAYIAGYDDGNLPQAMDAVYRGLDAGLTNTSKEFNTALLEKLKSRPPVGVSVPYLRLLVRLGDEKETAAVVANMKDAKLNDKVRIEALHLLALAKSSEVEPFVIAELKGSKTEAMLMATLGVGEGLDGAKLSGIVFTKYAGWPAAVKRRAVQALLSRKEWATELFNQLDAGKFPKADVSIEQARTAVALGDKELTVLVEKHFGKLQATAGEKQARIASLNTMLGRGSGDAAKGQRIFAKNCEACHTLFGQGGKTGPDLTTSDRKNRGSLLASIVDPSGYIRPEYVTQVVNTLDGRTLTGLVTHQTAEHIQLSSYENGLVMLTAVKKKDIDRQQASAVSVMPEKLLDGMSDADIRDLFAFMAGDKLPIPTSPAVIKAQPADSPKKDEKKKFRVALVSGSDEYQSGESLPKLQRRLEDNSPVECVRIFFTEKDTDFSKLDELKDCDAAVFFTRRLKLGDDPLKAVKAYCDSGKPVVGIRTASHGFQTWLEMDKEVYGGNYKNHYKAGDKWELKATADGEKHPIMKGVKTWASEASLYRNTGAAKDITVLMTGGGKDATEPVTWTREREVGEKKAKQRIFYTSLGHPKDFDDENFLKLLVNGLAWATQDERLGK
jgi:putative heme-binding domain-containing protein